MVEVGLDSSFVEAGLKDMVGTSRFLQGAVEKVCKEIKSMVPVDRVVVSPEPSFTSEGGKIVVSTGCTVYAFFPDDTATYAQETVEKFLQRLGFRTTVYNYV